MKEELEDYKISIAKEAWDAVNTCTPCHPESFVQGYIAGAGAKRNQIKILGDRCNQLLKDKGELTDKVKELEEKLANADYQLEGRDNEIRELKAQIEEMKCCGNCQTVRDANGNCYLHKYGKCNPKTKDKWEIKEK